MPKRPRSSTEITTEGPPLKKFKLDAAAVVEYPENIIPQLNDDCLMEIFSYLSLKDMCAIKECSMRFCALAESFVQKQWRNKVFDFPDDDEEVPVLLPTFGGVISHLSITDSVFVQDFDENLSDALTFCTSLKTLKLKFVDLSLIPLEILENIEDLELYKCSGNDSIQRQVIKACTKLKNLKLMTNPKECLLTAINEMNIESVSWEVFSATNNTFVNEVKKLSKLKKLKKLYVHGYEGYTFRGVSLSYRFPQVTETIKVLAKNRSLEELVISHFDPDKDFFKAFNKFVNLKRCVLSTYVEIPDANQASATNFKIEKSTGTGFVRFEYIVTPK